MSATKGKRRRSDSSSSSSSSDSNSSTTSNNYKKSKHSDDSDSGASGSSKRISKQGSKKHEKKSNSHSQSRKHYAEDNYKKRTNDDTDRYVDKNDRQNEKKYRHSDRNDRHEEKSDRYNENNNRHRRHEDDRYRKNEERFGKTEDEKSHRDNEENRHPRRDNNNDRKNMESNNGRPNDRRESYKADRHRRNEDDYSKERRRSPGRDRRDNRNHRRNRSRSRSFDNNTVWGKKDQSKNDQNPKSAGDKQKPNFGLSGKLTEETNTYKGVVVKYSEPPEARKAKRRWRLYPFKGEKALQTLYIHRESAYLIGRERKVVDLPVDHPSCSKQHAALQYRLVPFTREDGSSGKRVRPYLIDLDSANGTFINNQKIEPRKYVELFEKDVIKFGFSSREYVLLHENSKDETQDDDVKLEEEEPEGKVKVEKIT